MQPGRCFSCLRSDMAGVSADSYVARSTELPTRSDSDSFSGVDVMIEVSQRSVATRVAWVEWVGSWSRQCSVVRIRTAMGKSSG